MTECTCVTVCACIQLFTRACDRVHVGMCACLCVRGTSTYFNSALNLCSCERIHLFACVHVRVSVIHIITHAFYTYACKRVCAANMYDFARGTLCM